MTQSSWDDSKDNASSENPSSKTIRSVQSSINSFVSINKISSNYILESDISHNDRMKEKFGKPKLENYEHIINRIIDSKS
jgi:hypothetical protein